MTKPSCGPQRRATGPRRVSCRALLFASLVAAPLWACGASAPTSGEAPYTQAESETGELLVEVHTGPEQPPVRGRVRVELVVTTRDGAPAQGLTIELAPVMPAMGHGSGTVPVVVETAPGRYVAEAVHLSMPGLWELRATIGGTRSDRVALRLQVR